jgi:hypothetical protein
MYVCGAEDGGGIYAILILNMFRYGRGVNNNNNQAHIQSTNQPTNQPTKLTNSRIKKIILRTHLLLAQHLHHYLRHHVVHVTWVKVMWQGHGKVTRGAASTEGHLTEDARFAFYGET